jgi:riboflavin synthase
VCLTVTAVESGAYWVEAVAETLLRTTLGGLSAGDRVNLERPVRLSDRMGGHLVQGHVDGVGEVLCCRPEGSSTRMRVEARPEVLRYVVDKGSVALDGVSLTVTSVDDRGFEVAIVPHTAAATTLGHRGPGDRVNIEVDVIAKYVEKLSVVTSGGSQG